LKREKLLNIVFIYNYCSEEKSIWYEHVPSWYKRDTEKK